MKKYYKLNYSGTAWGLIDIEKVDISGYNQIKLYDEKLNYIGIGLYDKIQRGEKWKMQ